jgi:hypothetical protein
MKLTSEQQVEVSRHQRLTNVLNEIVDNNPGYDENILKPVRDYVKTLLDKYGFLEITQYITVGAFEFYDAARDYKDEIRYVMEEHEKRLDPSWTHQLMSKRISEMTGYEYKTYLELIGKSNT